VGLLVVAQSLLVWLSINFENSRTQEQLDTIAQSLIVDFRQAFRLHQQNLHAILWNEPSATQWREAATQLLRTEREFLRMERRDLQLVIEDRINSPFLPSKLAIAQHDWVGQGDDLACTASLRLGNVAYSHSYFIPGENGMGQEVLDLCVPIQTLGRTSGFMVSTLSLPRLLEKVVPTDVARSNEISFVESDGTRLARTGTLRGTGQFKAERLIDVHGVALRLRVESNRGLPDLIPNLTTALVLGLSLGLGGVVTLLARDIRKRAKVEAALAEALAVRHAMENSLVAGLRARDLQGCITYVNPAFCTMVGFAAAELVGQTTPYYWPPESVTEYRQRQARRMSEGSPPQAGFESMFIRRNGERFAVMIYESPLVDGSGKHTGWMSAILDISAQRKIEEMSRQQHERLQATARLATVGEMASLLSHELNQPLAAIASYAVGSLNLMDAQGSWSDDTPALLRQAAQRIAEQAERAGKVIKSVHDFVRRRQHAFESIRTDHLLEAVLPLVRLQAHKSGTRIEINTPSPAPKVVCDRTMVEQVLLNLTRNGIQAMEESVALAQRRLVITVAPAQDHWVSLQIMDHGSGVPADVQSKLFTPFFTTRSEGMGLGLSLCRTVIEQHGGRLDFENHVDANGKICGAVFRFTLSMEGASLRGKRAVLPPPKI
jgi:two-component system, LuxR family, sensor histidine kinase DctS